MLSSETEYKLANFFYQILSGEKKVEEARFSLSKHRDFEISSAFNELDRIAMGSISSNDIRLFLEKNRISCTSQEAYLIIRQYDSNSDGRLSLAEFKDLVLPTTLPFSSQGHGKNGKLSLDAEFFLTKLLEAEVDLQRTSEMLRKEKLKQITKKFNETKDSENN